MATYNITKKFLKAYDVSKVEISSMEIYAPYYIVEYMDGRKITKNLYHTLKSYQVTNIIKYTIIDNSIFKNRKKKLDKIIKRI